MSEKAITRLQKFLRVLADESAYMPEPLKILEKACCYACGHLDTMPKPTTRMEKLIVSVRDKSIVPPTPVTRLEKYIAAIAGCWNDGLPDPVTLEDKILYDLACGEDVTISGNPLILDNCVPNYPLKQLIVGGMSRKGRNLLDITRYTAHSKPVKEITVTVDANSVAFDVPVTSEIWQAWRINLADIRPGTYVVSAKIGSSDAEFTPSITIYKSDGNGNVAISALTSSGAVTVTIPDGANMFLSFHATTATGATAARTVTYSNVMVSQTAVDYEPYTDTLLDAPVDAVRVANAAGDNTNTYQIPDSLRDLCPDYGIGVSADCYNYIDFAAKQYHHRVGKYVFNGSEDYLNIKQVGTHYRVPIDIVIVRKSALKNTLFASYTLEYNYGLDEKHYYVDKDVWPNGKTRIYVFDIYATIDALRAALIGAELHYELATPEIIDLSAVWPDSLEMPKTVDSTTIISTLPDGVVKPPLEATYKCNVRSAEKAINNLYTQLLTEMEDLENDSETLPTSD